MKKLFSRIGMSAILVLGISSPIFAADHQLVEPVYYSETINFQPLKTVSHYLIKVGGPDDLYFELDFSGAAIPFIEISDGNGNNLPDGLYTYEVIATPMQRMKREANDTVKFDPDTMLQSGYFRIDKGLLILPEVDEAGRVAEIRANKGDETDTGSYPAEDADSDRAQVFVTDVIVQGSECVGFDCTNGESFGSDTLRLKENNLRIHFNDTSNSGSFPTADWRIVANDTSNGGANYLAIEDSDSGTYPFRVLQGAGNNALYVDAQGDVGLNTSNPVVELHIADGDSPTIRLEQNGSSGFTAQTWDIAGNETNFFVRDVTSGSKLPFRIRPGAPDNSIYIDTDGDVGMGTNAPTSQLQIKDTAGNAGFITLTQTNATVADRDMFVMENTGGPRMLFTNTDNNVTWRLGTEDTDDDFIITRNGSGALELQLTAAGNLTVQGTVMGGSSRTIKENIEQVNPRDILEAVIQLPIAFWNYTADENDYRHIGPMAEDFWDTFQVGLNDKSIAPADMSGVALASVKALYDELNKRDMEMSELKKQNEELLNRLQKIEKSLDQ